MKSFSPSHPPSPTKKPADKVLKYETKNVYKQGGISVACQPLACQHYGICSEKV